MGRTVRGLLLVALLATCMMLLLSPVVAAEPPTAGEQAPSFSGSTIDGDSVSLDSLTKKPLVLVFWASW